MNTIMLNDYTVDLGPGRAFDFVEQGSTYDAIETPEGPSPNVSPNDGD